MLKNAKKKLFVKQLTKTTNFFSFFFLQEVSAIESYPKNNKNSVKKKYPNRALALGSEVES